MAAQKLIFFGNSLVLKGLKKKKRPKTLKSDRAIIRDTIRSTSLEKTGPAIVKYDWSILVIGPLNKK